MIEVWKCKIQKFLLAGFKLYASNENNSSIAPATYNFITPILFEPMQKKQKKRTGTTF
jgi:hypothetical protein